jgi:hypothetical protein
MAASRLTLAKGDPKSSVQDYLVEKWFYDYADNIEAVNIHYACTPLGQVPDWNRQRTTRFLPLVETRIRRKLLKLPARILDTDSGELRDQYLLHHYFEIFADGDTHYSPLYTEEVVTGAGSLSVQEPGVSDQPEKQEPDFSSRSSPGGGAPIAESPSSSRSSKKRKLRDKDKKDK